MSRQLAYRLSIRNSKKKSDVLILCASVTASAMEENLLVFHNSEIPTVCNLQSYATRRYDVHGIYLARIVGTRKQTNVNCRRQKGHIDRSKPIK
jgi:hypothetical protein